MLRVARRVTGVLRVDLLHFFEWLRGSAHMARRQATLPQQALDRPDIHPTGHLTVEAVRRSEAARLWNRFHRIVKHRTIAKFAINLHVERFSGDRSTKPHKRERAAEMKNGGLKSRRRTTRNRKACVESMRR
jgi:hypothetical protein